MRPVLGLAHHRVQESPWPCVTPTSPGSVPGRGTSPPAVWTVTHPSKQVVGGRALDLRASHLGSIKGSH